MKALTQQLKGLLWLILFVALGASFAVGLSPLIALIPWSVEKQAARLLTSTPPDVCKAGRHPEADAHFQRVVQRLYPLYSADASFPLTVQVIKGPEVNAYATLGGKVYVYEGLLREAESPEELAGVLAHEIEHVRARHILQGVVMGLLTVQSLKLIFSSGRSLGSEITRMTIDLDFSRQQERGADEGGLKRLTDAKIGVEGFERFFQRAKKEASLPLFLSDHPANADRAEQANRYRGRPTQPIMRHWEWEQVQAICQ